MSYCYDVMSRVFDEHIYAKLDPRLSMEFSMLIQAMHSANHRLNDGINKDLNVSVAARDLEETAKQLAEEAEKAKRFNERFTGAD